jgi:hypothetical protein
MILHLKDYNSYLEDYKNLDKADENNKVVISFTVSPDSINKIKPFLKSILNQTVKVDRINLNVTRDSNTIVPDEYRKMLSVNKIDKEYGDNIDCIPTIIREFDKNTKIIILSPDTVYGKDFIEYLIQCSNEDPNSVISSNNAILLKPDFIDSKKCFIKQDNWLDNNIIVPKKHVNYFNNYKSLEFFGAFSLQGSLKSGINPNYKHSNIEGVS